MSIRYLYIGAFLLILLGCGISPTNQQDNNQQVFFNEKTVELSLHESQRHLFSEYSIGFDSVYVDSRIVSDEYLGWGNGWARVNFWLYKPGNDTIDLEMFMYGGPDHPANYNTIDTLGLLISLAGLSPAITPTYQREYTAKLDIAKYTRVEGLSGFVLPVDIPEDKIHYYSHMLDTAYLVGDTLYIKVFHAGGCGGEHRFLMFQAPYFTAGSDTVEAELYLRHYNNGDYCNAGHIKTLKYGLENLKSIYQSTYADHGTIKLHLNHPHHTTNVSFEQYYSF